MGLPWWLSDKEFTCQGWRHRFNLWSRKIPHALKELSLCAALLSLCSKTLGTATKESPGHNY